MRDDKEKEGDDRNGSLGRIEMVASDWREWWKETRRVDKKINK